MFSVFLIYIASLICLPALSDSQSITLAFSQSIVHLNLMKLFTGLCKLQVIVGFGRDIRCTEGILVHCGIRCCTQMVQMVL